MQNHKENLSVILRWFSFTVSRMYNKFIIIFIIKLNYKLTIAVSCFMKIKSQMDQLGSTLQDEHDFTS